MQGDFREMEWDVATSWQLQTLRGNKRLYVAVQGLCDTYGKVATFLLVLFCYEKQSVQGISQRF